jgi:hypothetical protein
MTDEQLRIARDLIAEGFTPWDVARKLDLSEAAVKRGLKPKQKKPRPQRDPASGLAVPPGVDLSPDPVARLRAIRNGWLDLAEAGQAELRRRAADGETSNMHTYAAGISTVNALKAQQYLDRGYGLPEELPEDDEEARRLVLQVWYRHAKNGSQAATVKLAAALGVRNHRSQPISISFEGDEATEAPADGQETPDAPGSADPSEADPRLH